MPMQKCPTMCGTGDVGIGLKGHFVLLKCILWKYNPEGKIQSWNSVLLLTSEGPWFHSGR